MKGRQGLPANIFDLWGRCSNTNSLRANLSQFSGVFVKSLTIAFLGRKILIVRMYILSSWLILNYQFDITKCGMIDIVITFLS